MVVFHIRWIGFKTIAIGIMSQLGCEVLKLGGRTTQGRDGSMFFFGCEGLLRPIQELTHQGS